MAGSRVWGAVGGAVAVAVAVAVAMHFFAPQDAKPASANGGAIDTTSGRDAKQERDAATSQASAGHAAARWNAPSTHAPLPPLDAPLAAIVRELKPRAEAGDARALCRLAVEYRYCADLQDRMQMIESGVARAQQSAESGRRGGGWRSPERMASAFEETNRLYQHCEGVETPSSTEIVRYMRESAVAGHPQAASYYASGDMFSNSDMLDNLSELALYRDNAESIALAAVAQGDLRAAWELARAYASDSDDPRRPLLAQAVGPQPATALSLLYALRTSIGRAGAVGDVDIQALMPRVQERIASLEQRLPSADVALARSQPAKIGNDTGAGIPSTGALQRLSGAMSPRGRGGDWSRDICD
jgi:hypothetical protein